MASTTRIDELKKKFDENPRRYFAPLANEFRKAGDIEQAIVICEEFLPQQPGHMSGHIVYGQALYEAGRLPESRTVFETALALDPENLIALRHLGDIAQGQGDTSAARSWYRRVLDADPRNEEMQALIAALPAEASGPNVPIIAEEDFDLAATLSAPATVSAGARSIEIEKEEPALQAAEPELEDTQPLGMPAVASAPTPPPLPSSELIEGFSLHGFESAHQHEPADMAHATAEGLESTSFEPPTEPIPGATDLDDSLDSGVPSFEAPTQVIAALDGLQGSGEDTQAADSDEITQKFPAAQRPTESAAYSAASHSELLDFEMPAASVSEPEPVASMTEQERRDDDAPPVELPPSVIAAEAELIEAGETPAPTYASEAEMEAEAASAAPTPFVTETMAELYVAQGFREEALLVYLQLLAANPSDVRLQSRVASLTLSEPAADSQLTAREFFARMASRRPGTRGAAALPPAEAFSEPAAAPLEAEPEPEPVAEFVELDLVVEELEAPLPPPVPESRTSDVAPAIERAAAMRTPSGSLDALFGNRPPRTSEDSAASALAQAFGATAESEPQIVGRPARAAAAELSLDSVFRDGPARPPRTSQSFSFDQFFSGGAATGGNAEGSASTPAPQTSSDAATPAEPPAERSADDVQQFNSWLQGLKPR